MSAADIRTPEQLLAYIQYLLDSTPPGQNPWATLRVGLALTLAPVHPPSTRPLLITASVICALDTAVFLAVFAIRLRRRTCWLFDIRQVRAQHYLLPHYSNNWALCLTLFLLALQGLIWSTIIMNGGSVLLDFILWKLMPWMAGGVAICAGEWSLLTTYVLHLITYAPHPPRSSGWPFYTSAAFINAVGILTPLLHIASVTVFSLLSSHNYRSGVEAYKAVDQQLLIAQDAWNGTFDASIITTTIEPVTIPFQMSWNAFSVWFARTFYLYLAWSSLFLVLFVLIAGLYIRALRKTVQDLSKQDRPTTNIATSGVERKTIDPFVRTMKALSWVTVPFVIVCSASVANFAWVAIMSRQVIFDSRINELGSVVPTLIIGAISFPVALVLLRQALLTPSSSGSHPSHHSWHSHPHNPARWTNPLGYSHRHDTNSGGVANEIPFDGLELDYRRKAAAEGEGGASGLDDEELVVEGLEGVRVSRTAVTIVSFPIGTGDGGDERNRSQSSKLGGVVEEVAKDSAEDKW
ncbi:hypothetical protein JCM1840_002066 [Sporobolomyces johnsonii]